MVSPRPRLVAILPGIIPSTLMTVIKPFLRLQAEGEIDFHILVEQYPGASLVKQADLVVFCRNAEPRYQFLDLVLGLGIPYIYDMDDNLFEVPPDSTDGQYYSDPERAELLRRYLQSANLVRVYSQPLSELVKPLSPRVQVMVPPLDWQLFQPARRNTQGELVRIVYATSRRDDNLFTIFADALLQILARYSSSVEVYFWGFRPAPFSHQANVRFIKFTYNYDQYARQFSRMGFDIGLAPLLDDRFHRSKTNNKFREYGACGIAGIYSDVTVYDQCIEDRQTGILVPNTTEAWYVAMETLITDPALRHRIGQAAREKVQRTYSPEYFEAEWKEQIHLVLEQAKNGADSRRASSKDSLAPAPGNVDNRSRLAWMVNKARRAASIFGQSGPGAVWENARFHMNNLWWLLKVNILKRT